MWITRKTSSDPQLRRRIQIHFARERATFPPVSDGLAPLPTPLQQYPTWSCPDQGTVPAAPCSSGTRPLRS